MVREAHEVTAVATATVADIGPGFDVLDMAGPRCRPAATFPGLVLGDVLEIARRV